MKNYRHSNTTYVVHLLLKTLAVKHSLTGLRSVLQQHPHYPSLLAIKDSLSEWKLTTQALSLDKDCILDIDRPFIAHLEGEDKELVFVSNIDKTGVTYSDYQRGNRFLPISDFVDLWSGTAIFAESDFESGEPQYQSNRFVDYFKPLAVPALVFFFIVGSLLSVKPSNFLASYFILLGLNIIGIAVSVILLMTSIDDKNPFISKICFSTSKSDCRSILKSSAASITPWLSWSEVGFFYFIGYYLSALVFPQYIDLYAFMNMATLPFTIYSFAYQIKNKTWCLLCSTIQLVLISTFVVNVGSGHFDGGVNIDLRGLLGILLIFLTPILLWYILKPLIVSLNSVPHLTGQLRNFKYDREIFEKKLTNQKFHEIDVEYLNPIKMGNPNAKNTVTIVSNPFCGPCSQAHKKLKSWAKYRDDINVNIIFSSRTEGVDNRLRVARHIIAIARQENITYLENAMNTWYASKIFNYRVWEEQFPTNVIEEDDQIARRHSKWCRDAGVTHTPTIYLNGFKLPNGYNLEDIRFLTY